MGCAGCGGKHNPTPPTRGNRAPNGGTRDHPWCKDCKWVMLKCNIQDETGKKITEFSCVNMKCKQFQKPQPI